MRERARECVRVCQRERERERRERKRERERERKRERERDTLHVAGHQHRQTHAVLTSQVVAVLDLRTTTSHHCEALPRRARV